MLKVIMAPTIEQLYPELTEAERLIAQENLERYLALVVRIFERQEAEQGRAIDQHGEYATL